MTFEDVLLLRLGNNRIEDMSRYMEIMGLMTAIAYVAMDIS